MAIVASDIVYRLSGGSANAAAAASLGGVKSSVVVPSAHFDDVDGTESTAGDVEYRCLYVHNAHATLTLTAPVIWLQANTASSSTTIDIGLGTSAANATEQTIANESTAPSGVTFSAAASAGAGIALGDILPGQSRAVWLRRTVIAAAPASNDTYNLRVTGDTAA